MCSRAASFLVGKHKPIYKKGLATYGDIVVIVNAGNIKLTGKKAVNKVVRYHTGYVGSLKEIPIREFLWYKPEQLVNKNISKIYK